ncbi:MAG TPA: YicC/YloC family endoribonuclease [Stellaceae bacterium]|nr:YicC/YloC family endoribonuclease [Stellaceae bacterium]
MRKNESRAASVASMTGFARAEGEAAGVSWIWEVKSVNGKSLDLRLRLAPGFEAIEPLLRNAVTQRFRRGNISASLSTTRTTPPVIRVNREALAQIISLLNDLSAEIEAAPPRLDGLLALRGVVETVDDDSEEVAEARRAAILDGWERALDRLAAARAEEGARLALLLRTQLREMRELATAAAGCAAAQPAAIRERLRTLLADLADLAPAMPEERLAQEAALIVARSDVREELERLVAHIEQAGELLSKEEAVGRRLDFLCQELNREANTLCSKSSDIELTRIGLSLKASVEQFREQVQNLE